MADIDGYVNPRSLGNSELQQELGMDFYFEQALWDKYIQHKNTDRQSTRTWDVFFMSGSRFAGPPPYTVRHRFTYRATKYGNKEITLCIYWHPTIMALCVGVFDPEAAWKAPEWVGEMDRLELIEK